MWVLLACGVVCFALKKTYLQELLNLWPGPSLGTRHTAWTVTGKQSLFPMIEYASVALMRPSGLYSGINTKKCGMCVLRALALEGSGGVRFDLH